MYNIAITKEKETSFFNDADDKPRQYQTLADALVSAQYLGLTQQDVDLHFVKEGATIETITMTTTATAVQGGGGDKPADNPLERMNKEKLAAYAEEKGIAINAGGTKAEIRAVIEAAEEAAAKAGPVDVVVGGDIQQE